MNEFFVRPDGDNGNDGSKSHPFLTIEYAVDQLHAGDRLRLLTGTYYERIRFNDLTSIVISSADGHHATIDGARRDFVEDPEDAWVPVQPVVAGVVPGVGQGHMPVPEYQTRVILPPKTDRGASRPVGRPTHG